MCKVYGSTYPCGHGKERVEPCNVAKAAKVFRNGRLVACTNSTRIAVEADLDDTCGRDCLTKPYKCIHCDSDRKQVRWKCHECGGLWDESALIWNPCECPHHEICGGSVLGNEEVACDDCKKHCYIE